jgi:ABC-type Na+ efflux pump permease subunit
MTFLPIVERELRVLSRRPSTYWSRCGTLASAILAACFIYFSMSWGPQSLLGQELFYSISGLTFFFCLMAGIRNTSDCLSSEKREGTLGLLFLTDLKGYDVVFGKLVATSTRAFYDLLAIVPVLAIPFLMGGITRADLLRVTIVLCNTFFFSLSAGMFMSSISISSRKAMGATFMIVGVLPVGALIARYSIDWIQNDLMVRRLLDLCNPITCMTSTFMPGPTSGIVMFSQDFLTSVLIIHSAAWIFLVLCCLILPRAWQDKPGTSASRKRRGVTDFFVMGGNVGRVRSRRKMLDVNAFYWLASRERMRPLSIWLMLAVLAGFWCWGYVQNGHFWLEEGIFFMTIMTLNTILKFWICSESGRRLAEDRKIGSLELILSTPLSVSEIIRGQLLSLRRFFLWPLITVLLLEGMYMLVTLQQGGNSKEDIHPVLAFTASMMLMLVVDSIALIFTSMWISVTAKNPSQVTGAAYRNVVIFPSLFILMFYYIIAWESRFGSRGSPSWEWFWASYTIGGFVASVGNLIIFRGRLNKRFREVATQRFTPKVSLMGRLFGKQPEPAGDSNQG